MTQRAFVENGYIKDLGPEMPEYPAHMLADVPSAAAVGMTWDGTTAAWPDPSAGVVTAHSPSALDNISDRQFAEGLWHDEIITYEQFLAFVGPGTIPPPLLDLLNTLPDDDTGQPTPRKSAIGLVTGATTYYRADPLVDIVREAHGWTASQLDERWRVWATL